LTDQKTYCSKQITSAEKAKGEALEEKELLEAAKTKAVEAAEQEKQDKIAEVEAAVAEKQKKKDERIAKKVLAEQIIVAEKLKIEEFEATKAEAKTALK